MDSRWKTFEGHVYNQWKTAESQLSADSDCGLSQQRPQDLEVRANMHRYMRGSKLLFRPLGYTRILPP